jgi:hypothetical protein
LRQEIASNAEEAQAERKRIKEVTEKFEADLKRSKQEIVEEVQTKHEMVTKELDDVSRMLGEIQEETIRKKVEIEFGRPFSQRACVMNLVGLAKLVRPAQKGRIADNSFEDVESLTRAIFEAFF